MPAVPVPSADPIAAKPSAIAAPNFANAVNVVTSILYLRDYV